MATAREIGTATAGIATNTARLILTTVSDPTGIASPEYDLPPLTNSNAGLDEAWMTLTTGANTLTKPTNAVAVLLVPPDSNTVVWTIKGITGDTGVPTGATNSDAWAFLPVSGNIVINAASGITGFFVKWF